MNNSKIIIPKQILVSTIFVVLSVFVFTIWYDSSYFIYLIWNIFLAFLPFFVSAGLLWYAGKQKTYSLIFIFGFLLWLILFPNAPYLLTDLIHLGASSFVPIWIDLILLTVSAYIGVLLGTYSLFHIEQILLHRFNKNITNLIIYAVVLLSSFGIYLGRFLRWNSWDVFVQPKLVLNDILDVFYIPANHTEAYFTTALFFIFIILYYKIWKYFNKQKVA